MAVALASRFDVMNGSLVRHAVRTMPGMPGCRIRPWTEGAPCRQPPEATRGGRTTTSSSCRRKIASAKSSTASTFVTPSPNLRHQDVAGRLHLSIGGFLEAHPEHGRVFHSPLDVVFSFHDVVEPDLLFVASDQLEILTEKNVQGVPALVIEVLSPSTRKRDEKLKRSLYERGGVREYLAGGSQTRSNDGLSAVAGWRIPSCWRIHRRRWCRAHHAAFAGLVAGARSPVPLAAPFCLLPFAFCLLPFAFCLLPSAFCLLPSAFCLLPSAFCLLPSAFCLLPSAFCLLPSAFCLLPSAFLGLNPL